VPGIDPERSRNGLDRIVTTTARDDLRDYRCVGFGHFTFGSHQALYASKAE